MTIELLNQWLSLYNELQDGDRKNPVDFDQLYERAENVGLSKVMEELFNDHYISRMKDGNIFINWTTNRFYPDRDIRALKAELTSTTRQPSPAEQLAILQCRIDSLEARIAALEANQ